MTTDHSAIGKASRAKGNRYQRESCGELNDVWRKLNAPWECTVTGIYQRRRQDKATPDLTVTGPCIKCNEVGSMSGIAVCPHCHGKGKRKLDGECKGGKSWPLWWWQCVECDGDGHEWISDMHSRPCPRCKGKGLRGHKRKPREELWQILEGVRCPWWSVGDGIHPASLTASMDNKCPGKGKFNCHGTGWLKHPHDFLIVKRYGAKPACPWLVLVRYPITTGVGGLNEAVTNVMYQTITHPTEQGHDPLAIMTAAHWAAAICNVKE